MTKTMNKSFKHCDGPFLISYSVGAQRKHNFFGYYFAYNNFFMPLLEYYHSLCVQGADEIWLKCLPMLK